MTDMPPPYPGINGYNGYATASAPTPEAMGFAAPQQPSAAEAKAMEAAQSAYYDPNRPQMAYVPPPAYYVSYPKLLGFNFFKLRRCNSDINILFNF
jgi:WW domain-binding protein 2